MTQHDQEHHGVSLDEMWAAMGVEPMTNDEWQRSVRDENAKSNDKLRAIRIAHGESEADVQGLQFQELREGGRCYIAVRAPDGTGKQMVRVDDYNDDGSLR